MTWERIDTLSLSKDENFLRYTDSSAGITYLVVLTKNSIKFEMNYDDPVIERIGLQIDNLDKFIEVLKHLIKIKDFNKLIEVLSELKKIIEEEK